MKIFKHAGLALVCASMLSVGLGATSSAGAASAPNPLPRTICQLNALATGQAPLISYPGNEIEVFLRKNREGSFSGAIFGVISALVVVEQRSDPGFTVAACTTTTPTTTGR